MRVCMKRSDPASAAPLIVLARVPLTDARHLPSPLYSPHLSAGWRHPSAQGGMEWSCPCRSPLASRCRGGPGGEGRGEGRRGLGMHSTSQPFLNPFPTLCYRTAGLPLTGRAREATRPPQRCCSRLTGVRAGQWQRLLHKVVRRLRTLPPRHDRQRPVPLNVWPDVTSLHRWGRNPSALTDE